MVTTKNMTNNMVLEEVSDEQLHLREVMRNLQNQIDETQNRFEEELKALCAKNTTIRLGWVTKNLMPSIPILPGLIK